MLIGGTISFTNATDSYMCCISVDFSPALQMLCVDFHDTLYLASIHLSLICAALTINEMIRCVRFFEIPDGALRKAFGYRKTAIGSSNHDNFALHKSGYGVF